MPPTPPYICTELLLAAYLHPARSITNNIIAIDVTKHHQSCHRYNSYESRPPLPSYDHCCAHINIFVLLFSLAHMLYASAACLLRTDDMTNFTSLTPVTWETQSVFTMTDSRRTSNSRVVSVVTSGKVTASARFELQPF